jgi:hypothetical protein
MKNKYRKGKIILTNLMLLHGSYQIQLLQLILENQPLEIMAVQLILNR